MLSFSLFTQTSVPKAGLYGFLTALAASLILFRGFRSWAKVYGSFVQDGRMSAKIIVIVAAIGLIVGLIHVSWVSGRLSLLLAQLSHGPLFLTLVVVAEDQTLPMATIAPSLGQAITMATFANIVSDNLDGVSIEVAGGGAATLHMMEVARGNLELSMASPVIYDLMSGGRAMYANEPEAPQLAENIQLLMWFPYGRYHFTVRASSDIMTLDDLEGASVFLGPKVAARSMLPAAGLRRPRALWPAKTTRRLPPIGRLVSRRSWM